MNWTDEQVERINAYLDGELSAQERDAFEAEMARDDALRTEVAVFARVRDELGSLPELEVPRDFTIKEPEPAVSSIGEWLGRLRWMPSVAWGALAALVLVCGVIVLNSGGGFLGGYASEPEAISEAVDSAAEAVEVTVIVEEEVAEEEMADETTMGDTSSEFAESDDGGVFLRVGLQEAVVPLETLIAERFERDMGGFGGQVKSVVMSPYEDLCAGLVDVVMTSLEFARYVGECPQAIGFQIGWDAAVVVANVDAPLKDDIAVADLVALFFEESARWSDLNSAWRAEEIVRYVDGGERASLEGVVDRRLGDAAEAVEGVLGDPNGVGYFRFGDVDSGSELQIFAVNNVAPSEESIVSGVYPLSRKVYVYTTVEALENNSLVREYLAFALETVNEEVEKAGFFAVDEGVLEEGLEILGGFEG